VPIPAVEYKSEKIYIVICLAIFKGFMQHVDISPHCGPYTSHDSTGRDLAPPYTIY
jgi:hypothetical protein